MNAANGISRRTRVHIRLRSRAIDIRFVGDLHVKQRSQPRWKILELSGCSCVTKTKGADYGYNCQAWLPLAVDHDGSFTETSAFEDNPCGNLKRRPPFHLG